MAFAPVFPRVFSPTFDRRAAAAAVSWWLAGGAPTPVAVYQPKGAASLAASYVNLVNPGTYDAASGVAPTFDTATGWTFNSSTQYLTTGVSVDGGAYSVLVRFSDASVDNARLCATALAGNANPRLILASKVSTSQRAYGNGGVVVVVGALTAGVMAIAGQQPYLNGSTDGPAVAAWSGTNTNALYIGAQNDGGIATRFTDARIQAIAIWDTNTDHATWIPAVSAAVALI